MHYVYVYLENTYSICLYMNLIINILCCIVWQIVVVVWKITCLDDYIMNAMYYNKYMTYLDNII